MSDQPAAIETSGLARQYGRVTAVNGIDVRVPRHSICGFVGPNGAGKTTTIKILLGLIQPSAGRAHVFGLDAVRDSTRVRAMVGYLPQEPRFPRHMTVRQVLRFVVGFFPSCAADIDETLLRVGLEGRADTLARNLSGGERQRLGIAQALVHRPALLILDEPTSSLDPLGRHQVLELIAGLRGEATILFSSHLLDDVQRVCDRVAMLHQGRLVAHGGLAEVIAGRQSLEEAFLGLAVQP